MRPRRTRRRRRHPASAPVEVLVGRSMAAIAHPYAAWRVFPAEQRLLLLLGYLAIGYVTVLTALVAL